MDNYTVIYDEAKGGERIYNKGFDGYFSWKTGLLLAKYLRYTLGYGDARVKKTLIELSQKYDENFNYVRSRRTIRNMVRVSRNRPLVDTGNVVISQNDINTVRSIKNFKHQKILLSCILLAKRKTNKNYVNRTDWTLIKKLVSKKITNSDIRDAFFIFYKAGIVEPVNASQKMNLNDDDISPSVFVVNDDKMAFSLISRYKEYCGGELGYCVRCEAEFVKSSPRKKYCQTCSRENELNKYRKFNQKRKNKITTI